MKPALSIILVFLFTVAYYPQSKKITSAEYDKAFRFAVSETNQDYPLIFKVTTTYFEKGKSVRTEIELNENEAAGRYRIKRTNIVNGRETNKYQITAGFGSVYCSDDGVTWTGPTRYECPRDVTLYGDREAERTEYSVTEKSVSGKKFMVYRLYSVFAPADGSKTKTFSEKISTMDSRGFFTTVVDTEGTLGPKTITLTTEQSWTTQAKFDPVVAPK